MIFVILGSQRFQFNRLLMEIDELIQSGFLTEPVFAQIGYSDYKPRNYEYKDFLNQDEFNAWVSKSDIVVTHGGTGAIIGAVKKGKKVIAVPRLAKYGEHVDDHQLQVIGQLKDQNIICGLDDCSELKDGLEYVKNHTFDSYMSNTKAIVESIKAFIEQ